MVQWVHKTLLRLLENTEVCSGLFAYDSKNLEVTASHLRFGNYSLYLFGYYSKLCACHVPSS